MEALLTALASSELAAVMRTSRWYYAAANTTHVFGLALLIGSIIPLDLRLLGVWPTEPVDRLVRVLVPVAATGLAVAICAGVLIFLSRPDAYLTNPAFRLKAGLVAAGTVHALAVHATTGLATAPPARRRMHGLLSLVIWSHALVAGRLIAFTGD